MKKLICGLLILLVPISFAGCQGAHRLTYMTVVQAVGFDYSNGNVIASIQYLDLNKGNGKSDGISGKLTSTAYASGGTLERALSALEKTMPDRLFFGQNKIIAVGRSFYENSKDDFESFLLSTKCRKDSYIVVSDSAKAVIENGARGARVPSDSVCREIEKAKAKVTVNDYFAENDVKLPEIICFKDYCLVKKK